ncbi:MAG TPA: hypothetical protein PKA90_00675 [Ignavibacteria bacterium]|nr:hypothetical protein [Ignavibacteria bacterium]HMR38919.1 hypothetical protein [Ignavibacteria bacterium]
MHLEDVHLAQAINYLGEFKLEVGLLLNSDQRNFNSKESC